MHSIDSIEAKLNELITLVITPLTVGAVLPGTAIMHVLDPADGIWTEYASGGDASWFKDVVAEDSVIEIYRGVRLVYHGTRLLDFRW